MIINCIIVEDEPLALERIINYVKKIPFLHLIAIFDNGIDALAFLKLNAVHLLFLDINIGEVSGIEILEATNYTNNVIITTAYNEFALKGFDLNVTDYLLKPFTFERFVTSVDRVKNNLLMKELSSTKDYFFIKTEYRLEKIVYDEVLYIEGMRDYRKIHTINKKVMTLKKFSELEKEIPSNLICRVHKSYMVSLNKIDKVEKDLIRIKNTIIPVSETYKKQFLKQIKN